MSDVQQYPIETTAVFGDPNNLPHGERNLTPLAQLKRMQRVMFELTQDPDADKREIAQLACAWERLEARKAALTMRPAPKPIDVADLERAKERRRAAKSASGEPSWRKRPVVNADAQAVQRDPAIAAQDRTDPATRNAI